MDGNYVMVNMLIFVLDARNCVYEEGRFCETFHSTDDGWRDCESCGKLVHCGCVVSFNQYFLLDLGGVVCIECSKQNFILARNQRYAHELQTDPTDFPDLAKRVQLEPHYRPPSIDSDIKCIPENSKAILNPLFEKMLSASDLNCVYEEGRFCETFHSTDDGWRDCESCGKLVHCGCVVSFNQYFLLDLGGVVCIECSKQNFILARNQRYAHELQTDPTDFPDLAKRVQLEPHYRPPSIDSDIKCIPENSKAILNPLFEKMLSASDLKSYRIVIPKRYAEKFFPAVSEPRGIRMNILDMESKEWEVGFRYWPQGNRKTYVLDRLIDFMASRKLQAGDMVTFYREEPGGRMVIGIKKTSVAKPPHQATS
ncbi:DNA-binding pseudobarrel domain-containing protein [Artemisia annua]|uniref:DNA-binding pseudobarrel domain-containing protein n=1 Tax=Artemisia annua TaxID=35608 RepID=A0A2U1M0F9_ARTAN|nr:DNA-binding pseudobarrel domain-containing protein [Artemisia annua]